MNQNEKKVELNEEQLAEVNGGLSGMGWASLAVGAAGAGLAIGGAFVKDEDVKKGMTIAGGTLAATGVILGAVNSHQSGKRMDNLENRIGALEELNCSHVATIDPNSCTFSTDFS